MNGDMTNVEAMDLFLEKRDDGTSFRVLAEVLSDTGGLRFQFEDGDEIVFWEVKGITGGQWK